MTDNDIVQDSNKKVLVAVYLGSVWVDTGTLLIADPCYARRLEYPFEKDKNYDERKHTLVTTFLGDGNYPVNGLLNDEGAIVGVYIDFDWKENRKGVTVILDTEPDDDDSVDQQPSRHTGDDDAPF